MIVVKKSIGDLGSKNSLPAPKSMIPETGNEIRHGNISAICHETENEKQHSKYWLHLAVCISIIKNIPLSYYDGRRSGDRFESNFSERTSGQKKTS